MTDVSPFPAARLESGYPRRVWIGLLAAPAAWVTINSLDWWIGARACADGTPGWGPLPALAVRALLLLGDAATVTLAAVALRGSRRIWRELSPRHALTDAYAYGTAEYLAIAGVFISAVFLLATVWTALPVVMLDLCEGTR